MKLLSCQICGGELKQNGEHYECAYCRHQYMDDTLERAYHDLKNSLESVTRNAVDEAFVLSKERELANLRRELWARTHERYVNSRAITRICRDIKKINPDDFGARFYEVMNDESEETRLVTEFLDGIDVFEKEDYVDDVVDFVVKSLKIEYLPSLNMLVERAYKTDKAKYESVMTKIEDEAEKVEGGLYETQLSRDVFVAYSSKDIAIVNELVSYLESQGVSCFVALRNLQHGRKAVENYEKALETAMDNCRIFLFVSSRNSRSLSCDAIKREIPYIKKKDLEFKPEYRNNYEKMPEKYRKPRIQYRIDDVKTAIVDRQISEFFGTLQWRCDLDSVAEQIGEYLNQEIDDEPIARKEEQSAPQQPAFDQKALYEVFKQMRNEEEHEKVRQAEEKRKADERKKADFGIEYGIITKYKGVGGEVEIPEGVIGIAKNAFLNCTTLTSITIPSSVKTIGELAFSGCKGLKNVTILNGVTKIEGGAFCSCGALESIAIPPSVLTIGESAFWLCSGLKSITIPLSVANIGERAFEDCDNLTIFVETKSKPNGWDKNWNIFNYPVVWGYKTSLDFGETNAKNSDFTIENGVLKKYHGVGGNVVIPNGVTHIGEFSFEKCKGLDRITIPSSVINIGHSAFIGCSELKKVETFDGITVIDSYAFGSCTALTDIEIPSSVISIGTGAFNTCKSLTKLKIPSSTTDIGEYAFSGCEKLTSVMIPSSVVKIGHWAFHACENLTISAEAKAKPSGWESSWNPNNRPVVWGNLGEKITKTVSVETSDFEIENGVLKKYNGAGGNVIIPNGVTVIDEKAFYECFNLTSVEIPSSVTSIGKSAFEKCSALTNVKIPSSVTSIGESVFHGCSALTSVEIPSSLTSIANYAFYECSSLTSVKIPSSVTSIGQSAFYGCSALTSVKIPSSVTSIADWAFSGCESVTIHAETSKQPVGWNAKWNPLNRPVVWNYNAIGASANTNQAQPKNLVDNLMSGGDFAPINTKPVTPTKPSQPNCSICGSKLVDAGNFFKCYGCGNWFDKVVLAHSNQATTKSEPKPVEKKVEKVNVPTETVNIHLKHSSSPLSPANGSPYLIKIDDKISAKVVTAKTDTFGKVEVPIGRHILTVALFAYGDPDCRGNAIWKTNVQIVIEKGKSYVIEITPYKFLGSPKIEFITK